MEPVASIARPLPSSEPAVRRTNTDFASRLREQRGTSTPTTGPAEQVGAFFDSVGRDQQRIDRTIASVTRGRDLDAAELLRVQDLLYRHSQRVELATKVVQSTTSALKRLLDTPV